MDSRKAEGMRCTVNLVTLDNGEKAHRRYELAM